VVVYHVPAVDEINYGIRVLYADASRYVWGMKAVVEAVFEGQVMSLAGG
jgi:hypothetical protein